MNPILKLKSMILWADPCSRVLPSWSRTQTNPSTRSEHRHFLGHASYACLALSKCSINHVLYFLTYKMLWRHWKHVHGSRICHFHIKGSDDFVMWVWTECNIIFHTILDPTLNFYKFDISHAHICSCTCVYTSCQHWFHCICVNS